MQVQCLGHVNTEASNFLLSKGYFVYILSMLEIRWSDFLNYVRISLLKPVQFGVAPPHGNEGQKCEHVPHTEHDKTSEGGGALVRGHAHQSE